MHPEREIDQKQDFLMLSHIFRDVVATFPVKRPPYCQNSDISEF